MSKPEIDRQAQYFVTEACNLACDGCPYPEQQGRRQQEIEPSDWKRITDFLYNSGVRLFCVIGGEPASYKGLPQVLSDIATYPDALVLLSTSGLHMFHDNELRRSISQALTENGIAISFDSIPDFGRYTVADSRTLKAQQGLEFMNLMQREFPDQFIYVANVMVTPKNLSSVLQIQRFLEERAIYTNLCTQQGRCFGEKGAMFDAGFMPQLKEVGAEMIRRKIGGGLVANSAAFLSQLPGVIGMEEYRCWEEPEGNPVIDVGPDGVIRYCSWIGQKLEGGPPGLPAELLIRGEVDWGEFQRRSRETTARLCGGCSWSRRDRTSGMVQFNEQIREGTNLPDFDPRDPKLQNFWVKAQGEMRNTPWRRILV